MPYRSFAPFFISNDILYNQIHPQCRTIIIVAVIVVIDGDEPDTQQWKNLLHVFAHTNVITSKTRKVLYDNGINLATAHTIHHLLKARSVEIAACVTIIHKIHDKAQYPCNQRHRDDGAR